MSVHKVASQINKISKSTEVITIEGDLSSTADVVRIVATTLKAFGGRVDILVNNASTIGPIPMPYLLDYTL